MTSNIFLSIFLLGDIMKLELVFLDFKTYKNNPDYYENVISKIFNTNYINVENQLKNQNVYFIIAFMNNVPCGILRIGLVYKRKTIYCIRQVLVLEEYRNQGIASAMYEKCIPILKELGATKILSFILKENKPSKLLHSKFKFYNKQKGYYENTYLDDYGFLEEMWCKKL